MSLKITHKTDSFTQKVNVNSSIFLRNFAEEVIKTARPNTPKDKDRLRNDVLKQISGLKGKIKWVKEYAIFQEVKQYRNYTTPGTGPHFAENAVRAVVGKTGELARKSGLI